MFEIIKAKINILQVIENDGHIIKKAGKNYKIICPFHKENTASFVIRPDRNTYKCFGCGEYGSVIDYYMKYHNKDLITTCRELSIKYGVELPETSEEIKKLQRQYQANARKIEEMKKNNKQAVEYCNSRGFTDNTIIDFDVGYSYEESFSKENNNKYDWCNIAIRNEYGQIVARARRKIKDKIKPLWENSYTNKIYEKSKLLFNLDVAKNNITDSIYIMEGYFDVMSFYEQGLKNATAYCGSRITDDQSLLLSKYIEKDTIILYMPDSDETGLNVIEDNIKTIKKYNKTNPINLVIPVMGCKDANDILLSGIKLSELKVTTAEQYILRKKLQNKSIENQYIIAKQFCDTVDNKMILSDIIKELSKNWDKNKSEVKEYLNHHDLEDEELIKDFIYLDQAKEIYKKEIMEDGKNTLKTGFWSLDVEIKGIRQGEIITCQARPGCGKTAFMLNFAIYTALCNKNAILFSQEQTAAVLYEKIQGILNKIPIDELNKIVKNGGDVELKNFNKLKERILIIEKAGISIEYVSKMINLANRKVFDRTDLVIIDYVQIMTGQQNTRREITENVILVEKAIAKNYKLSICNLSQVTRQKDRKIDEGARPTTLGMAKDSGAIEEGSDYIIGLWRESRDSNLSENEKVMLKNHIGVNLLKTKRGEANKKFEFTWYGDMQVIEDKTAPQNMDINYDLSEFENWEV